MSRRLLSRNKPYPPWRKTIDYSYTADLVNLSLLYVIYLTEYAKLLLNFKKPLFLSSLCP